MIWLPVPRQTPTRRDASLVNCSTRPVTPRPLQHGAQAALGKNTATAKIIGKEWAAFFEPNAASDTSRPRQYSSQFFGSVEESTPCRNTAIFMVEGIEHDDKYRMVEDELLSVAQTFTAHLHAAEYQRMKAQAKSHSAAAIRSMSRPVNSAPTDAVRRKQEAQKRAEKQQHALKRAYAYADRERKDGDDDDDTDDGMSAPWIGTSLETLMDGSPRKERLVTLMPDTTASAGQTSATQDDDDDDEEDDLDGPPASRRSTGTRPTTRAPSLSRPDHSLSKTSWKKPTASSSVAHKATPGRSVTFAADPSPQRTRRPPPPAQTQNENADDEDDDMTDDLDTGNMMQKIRQRREREKAQRQQQRQEIARARQQQQQRTQGGSSKDSRAGSSLDIIPSFL